MELRSCQTNIFLRIFKLLIVMCLTWASQNVSELFRLHDVKCRRNRMSQPERSRMKTKYQLHNLLPVNGLTLLCWKTFIVFIRVLIFMQVIAPSLASSHTASHAWLDSRGFKRDPTVTRFSSSPDLNLTRNRGLCSGRRFNGSAQNITLWAGFVGLLCGRFFYFCFIFSNKAGFENIKKLINSIWKDQGFLQEALLD